MAPISNKSKIASEIEIKHRGPASIRYRQFWHMGSSSSACSLWCGVVVWRALDRPSFLLSYLTLPYLPVVPFYPYRDASRPEKFGARNRKSPQAKLSSPTPPNSKSKIIAYHKLCTLDFLQFSKYLPAAYLILLAAIFI